MKTLDRLIRRIEADSISVQTDGRCSFLRSKASGHFVLPSIFLGTRGCPYLVLIALAHEYGHCLSIRSGRGLSFHTGMFFGLGFIENEQAAQAIIQEEKDAWRLGFCFLRRNGVIITPKMKRARKILLQSVINQVHTIRARSNEVPN